MSPECGVTWSTGDGQFVSCQGDLDHTGSVHAHFDGTKTWRWSTGRAPLSRFLQTTPAAAPVAAAVPAGVPW